MKRVIRILLAVVALAAIILVVISLSGEFRRKSGSDAIKIGVTVYRGDDTFIGRMMVHLQEIASTYEQETNARVYISIADAADSQSLQNEQIERFISLGYDVLCVNLVDRTNAAYIIDIAMNAGIPIVFFNREPVQEDMQKWDQIFYVGSDAHETARLEGQIIVDTWDNDPSSIDRNGDGVIQYIMLEGESRHQDTVIRTEESVATLRNAGIMVEKLDGGIANWNRIQAAVLIEQYFTDYPNQIELIICNNDDMALGAADALERMDIAFSNIVGIDGTPQGIEAVENGKMLGTVVVDVQVHAATIFDLAYALATGADPYEAAKILSDQSVRVPMFVITAKSET